MFLPREALATVRAEDHDIDPGSSFIVCSSNIYIRFDGRPIRWWVVSSTRIPGAGVLTGWRKWKLWKLSRLLSEGDIELLQMLRKKKTWTDFSIKQVPNDARLDLGQRRFGPRGSA